MWSAYRMKKIGLPLIGLVLGMSCVSAGLFLLNRSPMTMQVIKPEPRRVCLIDAGHGGEDGGTVGNGLIEKDITLDLAQRVALHLSARGERVIMTREHDHGVALADRIALAENSEADLFVSLHFNNAKQTQVQGWEIYTTEPRSVTASHQPTVLSPTELITQSRSLAESVGSALRVASVGPERGLRQGDFAVTRETPCAAILIEGGYLSHKAESARLREEATLSRLAEAISDGIRSWSPPGATPSAPVLISQLPPR
jgi:N-acetylmuramoyl-L-alanine amidase